MITLKMIKKLFAYLMKSCLYCGYVDVICKNQVGQWICIKHNKEIKCGDCCDDWVYGEMMENGR